MTIAAAESFIRRAVSGPELVQRINTATDRAAVNEIFSEFDISFTQEEFEQAYFNLLTCCQIIEQAKAVKEVKLWWDCLGYALDQHEKDVR